MRLVEWEKANELANNDELHQIDRRIRRDIVSEVPTSERFTLLAIKCLRKGLISRGKFSELLEIDRADIDDFIEYRDNEVEIWEYPEIEDLSKKCPEIKRYVRLEG